MVNHVMVGVKDLEGAKRFYDAVLGMLGVEPGIAKLQRYFYRSPSGTFAIAARVPGELASAGNGTMLGFEAESPDHVQAAFSAGMATGGRALSNPPCWREHGENSLFTAQLSDPEGNKIYLLHRPGQTQVPVMMPARLSGFGGLPLH